MLLGDVNAVNREGDKFFFGTPEVYILAWKLNVNRQLTLWVGNGVDCNFHVIVHPKDKSTRIFQAPLHVWDGEGGCGPILTVVSVYGERQGHLVRGAAKPEHPVELDLAFALGRDRAFHAIGPEQ